MFGIFEELDWTGSGLSGQALILMFGIFEEFDGTGSRPLCSVSLKSLTGLGGTGSLSLCSVSLKSLAGRGPGPYVRYL